MRRGRSPWLMCLIWAMTISTVHAQTASTTITPSKGAQETICVSDVLHERLMAEDAEYAQGYEALQENVLRAQVNGDDAMRQGTIYTIPLVVHVIHTGEPIGTGSNISDEQVYSAIAALNEDYRKMPGTNGDGAGADIEVEFCLASRAPNGDPTNGIVRVDGSSVPLYAQEGITLGFGDGATEIAVKDLSRWPRDDYYNIWIVNEIEDNNGGSGYQGFAYFPNSNPLRDGAVILSSAFGTVGNLKSYTSLNRTATHELGHAFFLHHTFQGNSCTESNCQNEGDYVCDTPPTTPNTSCNSPACSGSQQVENYMDYTQESCMDMFTPGQKTRMRDAIANSRSSLLTSLGCVPPNALDAGITAVFDPNSFTCNATINPRVELKNHGGQTLTSCGIEYRLDGGAWQSHSFSGNLISGNTIEVTLPGTTVGTGAHTFDVRTTSPNGSGDQFPDNDSFSTSFEVVSGSIITVDIHADNHGNETTWDVQDANGNIVASGGPYPIDAYGTTFSSQFCLPADCFDFTIYDSYGDGMCCSGGFGGYNVTDAGGNQLAAFGTDFTDFETTSMCVTQQDSPPAPPSADFSASQTSICAGMTVQFADQSTGAVTARTWSFPGGSPSSSTAANPSVTYASGGAKSVTLTVTNSDGTDAETKTNYIQVGTAMQLSAQVNSTSCFNAQDGAIDLSISGGTSPFAYDWSNGSGNQDISNLPAGTYAVQVVDGAGCQAQASYVLNAPSAISISTSTSSATCATPGSATVQATGGTPGYTYLWSDMQTSATASDLTAGSYTIIVTDANGCQASDDATVTGTSDMSVSVSTANVSCFAAGDGAASAQVSGGAGGYSYAWSGVPGATASSVGGLAAGTYSLIVTDAAGCQASSTFTVLEPSAIAASIADITHVTCAGFADGAATWSISGGLAPYAIVCDGQPSSSMTVSNLAGGTHHCVITDANGCTIELNFNINEPDPLVSTLLVTDESCHNGNDGALDASYSGGTAPHSFTWNGAGFGQMTNPTNAEAGAYTFTVTDSNGCVNSAQATVGQPAAITMQVTGVNEASCTSDGSATVSAAGGAGGFSYLWSDNTMQSGATATGLSGGDYTVIATDALGCQASISVVVGSSSDLGLSVVEQIDATCAGSGDASITVAATGGTGAFLYQWTDENLQTGVTASNLAAGVYGVTATDAAGCQVSASYTVTEPLAIDAMLMSITSDSCSQGVGAAEIAVAGGTGALEVYWDDPEEQVGMLLRNVDRGTYIADINDSNACEGIYAVDIDNIECGGTVGLSDESVFGFSVSPNPLYGQELHIRLSALDIVDTDQLQLTLFDLQGKMHTIEVVLQDATRMTLNIPAHMASGTYLLRLQADDLSHTERIVLIR